MSPPPLKQSGFFLRGQTTNLEWVKFPRKCSQRRKIKRPNQIISFLFDRGWFVSFYVAIPRLWTLSRSLDESFHFIVWTYTLYGCEHFSNAEKTSDLLHTTYISQHEIYHSKNTESCSLFRLFLFLKYGYWVLERPVWCEQGQQKPCCNMMVMAYKKALDITSYLQST